MKRILFVDDEPNALEDLRDLLYPLRLHWDISFALSGASALAKLEREDFDVLVADIRMPGMSGVELLARVQEEYPSVIRIAVTEPNRPETALQAVPVAHQSLAKPCDIDLLKELVDRASALQALLSDETLRSTVAQMGELPSSPRLYTALTQALADPDVSLSDVVKIVEQDIAMSAKCLQMVNSAFFALPRRVSDVRQAVAFLGTRMLRNLVFSAEVFRMFQVDSRRTGFSFESLEQHALLAAGIARRLVESEQQGEDAFMAAMLHDIGKLILATRRPKDFAASVAFAQKDGLPLHVVERKFFGVTHAEIGAYLLGLWGLPYTVVESVAYHHLGELLTDRRFDVPAAVFAADILAYERVPPTRGVPREAPDAAGLGHLEALGGGQLAIWRGVATNLAAGNEAAALLRS